MFSSLKSSLDLSPYQEYLANLKYKKDDTTVLMHVPPSTKPSIEFLKLWKPIVDEIEEHRKTKVKFFMINTINPGTEVPVHTDTLPYQLHHERWHLVVSGDKSIWWGEEDGEQQLFPGYWYGPMKFWLPHSVANRGVLPRTHLIFDLERIYDS